MMTVVKPVQGRRDRIADLMADGLSNAAIAERLGCSRASVTGQVAAIRKALGWQAA